MCAQGMGCMHEQKTRTPRLGGERAHQETIGPHREVGDALEHLPHKLH